MIRVRKKKKGESCIFQYEFTGVRGNCDICNKPLEADYFDIIYGLKKNGLLPEEYEKLCCSCYNIKRAFKLYNIHIVKMSGSRLEGSYCTINSHIYSSNFIIPKDIFLHVDTWEEFKNKIKKEAELLYD